MSAQDRRILLLQAQLKQTQHCLSYAISKLGGELSISNDEMEAHIGDFSISQSYDLEKKPRGVILTFTPKAGVQPECCCNCGPVCTCGCGCKKP